TLRVKRHPVATPNPMLGAAYVDERATLNGEQTQKHATRRGFRCVCVCSPGEVLALGSLVGGPDSRPAETYVVLQSRGDVVDLTLVRGSPQLPAQLRALRETRRTE